MTNDDSSPRVAGIQHILRILSKHGVTKGSEVDIETYEQRWGAAGEIVDHYEGELEHQKVLINKLVENLLWAADLMDDILEDPDVCNVYKCHYDEEDINSLRRLITDVHNDEGENNA